jgi:hypothetical protein
LTYSCDNQFLSNTYCVMMNICLNNRCTSFAFCLANIVKTIIISFVYIRERERTRWRRAEMQTSLKCIYMYPTGKRTGQNKVKKLLFSRKLTLLNRKVHNEHLYQISIYNASNQMNSSIDKNMKHVNCWDLLL